MPNARSASVQVLHCRSSPLHLLAVNPSEMAIHRTTPPATRIQSRHNMYNLPGAPL